MSDDPALGDLEKQIETLKKEQKGLLKLVSHDVKSPFNKLFALSNLLQLTADNLTDEQKDYLIRMDWVIKEGLTVVRNLLDLRAIESGEIELYNEELNLCSIIKETVNGYQKQIGVKKLTFGNFDCKVTIQSDKRLLERVVDHLVCNAIKFSPLQSQINLSVTTPGASILFAVSSESGPVPEEEIKGLFKKHTTLSTRPTHGENALGNGLFIAQ